MHPAIVRLGSLLVLLGLVPACGPSTCSTPPSQPAASAGPSDHDHDHAGHADHEHAPPGSFAEGVTRLETLSRSLAETMSDEGVHEIGHALEEAREAAKKLASPADDLAAITKALDDLEECFGKVDEAFHAGDDKIDPKQVLDSVKERIEGAFKTIKEVL